MKRGLGMVGVCMLLAQCTSGGSAPVGQGDTGIASSGPTVAYAPGQSTPVEILQSLEGDPLQGPTNLALLIENTLVDVDSSERTQIAGLPAPADGDGVFLQTVGSEAVVTYDHGQCAECDPRIEIFDVAPGSLEAERIATDVFVAPADHALWAKRYLSETKCTVSMIGLDGLTIRGPRAIACSIDPVRDTSLGLLALDQETAQDVILDPKDLHEILRAERIHAVVGKRVLVSDLEGFAFVNVRSGRREKLPEPVAVGYPSGGEVSPDGRYVAIEFRNPAQYMDLWVLDLQTLDWIHAPSMPVLALVKRTGPLWSDDGRLVLLGFFGAGSGNQTLVVWSPGQAQLAIRSVDYPDGSFVLRS